MPEPHSPEAFSPSDRLAALLDHLGLDAAHFATQMPGDLAELAMRRPERIAGVVFAVPVRLDPLPFQNIGARVLIVTGDSGVSCEPSRRGNARLDGSTLIELSEYATTGWSDIAKERPRELAQALTAHLSRSGTAALAAVSHSLPRSGAHAGVTYRIEGAGPPLILMPFFLAPSQWDPVVGELAGKFSVIRIGGAHVGGAAILEERAAVPTYKAMFRSLAELLDPTPGARVLEVGCGSGALARMMATRLGRQAQVTALDLNAYLLGEAKALAQADGLGGRIDFALGSAEALPFADATFDCAYSVTVLEECDADRALAEIVRVTKPGGRIGIIVRAIDMAQWWSLDLPPELAAKAAVPPQSVGPGGVADKSLYARMKAAGLVDLVPFPSLVTLDRPGNSVWRYREDHMLALLSDDELGQWHAAREKATAAGTLFQAQALHCAVGRKA